MKLKYCKNCLIPETKPDTFFDENDICNACINFQNRKSIDWTEREKLLASILENYKNKSYYDCIVPVSGGKDSHFQVLQMLKHGMNPLCITASTDMLSTVGRQNIENIKKLGVDHIEISVNPKIRRKINKITLREIGDISWTEHILIFTIPTRMSIQMNIPLIVWGENPQNEYGGPANDPSNKILNRNWLEEFGGLLGFRTSDLKNFGFDKKDLIQYTYPTDEQLQKTQTTGLFLGYFVPWDGETNALFAKLSGFLTYGKLVQGSVVDYENLDNYQTGIHDYFKYLKYGFSRTTDIISLFVRRNKINRTSGLEIVKKFDGAFPHEYLDGKLNDILKEIDISFNEFIEICDKFTNKMIFVCDENGTPIRDKNLNLQKRNYDNDEKPIKNKILKKKKIGILNLGINNIGSISNLINSLGAEILNLEEKNNFKKIDHIILPGVGSFSEASKKIYLLKINGILQKIRDCILLEKIPTLGICLGAQILFTKGYENSDYAMDGLDFLDGEVVKLDGINKLPHIGWNSIEIIKQSPILENIPNNSDFYFCHSFHVVPKYINNICATTPITNNIWEKNRSFVSVFENDNIFGVQFHPEKSSALGRLLLENFLKC